MSRLIQRQTSITQNVVGFSRFLRTKGYRITVGHEADVMKGLELIPPVSEQLYIDVLRACLAKNNYQYVKFEEYYQEYLFELKNAVNSKEKEVPEAKQSSGKNKAPSIETIKNWLYHNDKDDPDIIPAFSEIEVLGKKRFSEMSRDELEQISRIIQKWASKLLRKQSRIRKQSKQKKHLDLKMTLRKNMRQGGELIHIVFSKRKKKKLRLVLLCDVSQSMDLYSRFFIRMIYAFQRANDRIETFVFSTALHQISDILSNHEMNHAMEILSERVPQWSGGTRIGECLRQFNEEYAYRIMDKKTIVLILSDGWDTGSADTLRISIRKLHKNSRKILWLNPLAGHPDFKPDVIGLQTVMPYVHKMYAAHNLESLKMAVENI